MAADEPNPVNAGTTLAPLPDHRNVGERWWQELWRRHTHITTPLRARGLPCDIEFGLSAYIVRVSLPDDSYLTISPPQEPPSERRPGDPEGWIVTREDPYIVTQYASGRSRSTTRPAPRFGSQASTVFDEAPNRYEDAYALKTADGGALVLFSHTHAQTDTVANSGLQLNPGKDDRAWLHDVPRTSIRYTFVRDDAATVPAKAEPSRLIGYTCARTDASGPRS